MISSNLTKKELINTHYRLETIEAFKEQVKKELAQGIVPQTLKVLQIILPYYELSMSDLNQKTFEEVDLWLNSLASWEELKIFLNDSNVREIIIHNQNIIELKFLGTTQILKLDLPLSNIELKIQHMVNLHRVIFDFNHPFVSFNHQLYNENLRVSISHNSIMTNKSPKVFLRKLSQMNLSLDSFAEQEEIKVILELVKTKKNIIVAGSTGSGKTTFISQLLSHTDENEHVIILEDTAEIPQLRPNFTCLIADPLSEEKSLESYMRYALRMSPDRIIIGELRSFEIIPFILAMNTGHKGLLSSLHASSARDTLYRLALLFSLYGKKQNLNYQNILNLICNNLEYVIFLKDKKVQELIKIIGMENDQLIYNQLFSRV